jgi:diguanylate cyclase (GGDEF)-like protein
VELIARMLPREGDTLRMVVVRDIRDRQAARSRMRHLAEHDALTGLRNRGAFMEALGTAIERHAGGAPSLALLFVDLDHFKQVNDTHGHLAGDALLRCVAERLLGRLRDGAVAGRFGGDEFVILMPEVASRAEAHEAGLRLLAAMAEPVAWGGQLLSVTPTIGVALYPDDSHSADALLRHADAAMYAGKAAGRAVVAMFEPAMAAAIEHGLQLDERVAEGLALGEFHLMLQPRLALAGAAAQQGLRGRLGGLQAVLRWRHPERGWLAPADFTGGGRRRMLQTLLDWALQEALRLAMRWQALGVVVPLSLNLNGLAPQAEGLAAAVGRALAQQPMAEPPLGLELPEALLAGDRALVRRTFDQLAQLGTPLWLDDFGHGGAALADLRHLPLAGLLIGPSLVGALPQDAATAAVLRGITTLADGLGLPVCATGVATGAQAEALRSAGCHLLQGGWYVPPMTAADASAWLASGPH